MPEFTDVMVQEELSQMTNLDIWPLYPILPVKNLLVRQDNWPTHGVMFANDLKTVYKIMLHECAGRSVSDIKNDPDVPNERYVSTEALVRAGWVGD